MTDFMFEVRFDNEAGVWVATGDNIAITTEAATVEELRAKLQRMVADLTDCEPDRIDMRNAILSS